MSRKIRTAEELEKMSPAEVDAEFRAGIINGEPSTNDFQNIELLRIVDVFAEEFDALPALLPDRPTRHT